jgi:hypothetical protein
MRAVDPPDARPLGLTFVASDGKPIRYNSDVPASRYPAYLRKLGGDMLAIRWGNCEMGN